MLKVLIPMSEANLNGMRVKTHLFRETYVAKMVKHGILPIFVTTNMTEKMQRELRDMCSGLLIMGGFDISPDVYGSGVRHKETKFTNKEQDVLDIDTFHWAYETNRPVLGICRGHQIINVALGGSLHQHISDISNEIDHDKSEGGGNYDNAGDVYHLIKIKKGTRLHGLMRGEDEVVVNSAHHQAIDSLGENMCLSAIASDGVVESIESVDRDRFCFGVQSHPEFQEDSFFEPLFAELVTSMEKFAKYR